VRASTAHVRHLCRVAGVATLTPLLLAAVFLLIGPPAQAKVKDQTPPTFAGLDSAVTCTPGPIGGGTSASYVLRWNPAADDVSPPKKIEYDVYQTYKSGGEDFTTPTYTTHRGATSFTTPPLPADKPVYFVVRARDQAGNRDSNTVERPGTNMCV
jgi:hypothetical protein